MAEQDLLDDLKSLPFFAELNEEQLGSLKQHVEARDLLPKEVVFEQGDKGDAIYFIVKGEIDVLLDTGFDERLRLATLGKGNSFGEMSIVDKLPRSATVMATTYARVLSIDSDAFEEILTSRPEVGVVLLWQFCRFLSEHLRENNDTMSDFLETM